MKLPLLRYEYRRHREGVGRGVNFNWDHPKNRKEK